MTVRTVLRSLTIPHTISCVRWKCWMTKESWSARRICSTSAPYNELKEKCRPFLEALEHFPEVAKLFAEKVKQLFSLREAQLRAEKEAKEKARQERINARRNKRGMER